MSNLFHDLKNQLTIVLGISHLILNTADGLTYDNVKTIELAGFKMNELLAIDDNAKAKCEHPYRIYCYGSNLIKQKADRAHAKGHYRFNYCPGCGQQLMKGE